jgi:hypothetical protein
VQFLGTFVVPVPPGKLFPKNTERGGSGRTNWQVWSNRFPAVESGRKALYIHIEVGIVFALKGWGF